MPMLAYTSNELCMMDGMCSIKDFFEQINRDIDVDI